MNRIEIYTKSWCPYSIRARRLLQSKAVEFDEIDVTSDFEGEAEMIARAEGRTSVPQIFIDGQHVGGYDDLAALDARGELDRSLGLETLVA
jgi:glutaredoxin 3